MTSRITGQSSVCSRISSDWSQRNIYGPRYCPFVRESTRDRWIHFTKGQVFIRWRHDVEAWQHHMLRNTQKATTTHRMDINHDDVIKWKLFPVTGGFPSQRPVTQSFEVFLICVLTNSWANSQDAGDLRRHRAHYDVILMTWRVTLWALIGTSRRVPY